MSEKSEKTEKKYELLFCIVNIGYADTVMDAAREAGARGGTMMSGRGGSNLEAENFFHIAIQAEKEIMMILVPEEIRDDVMRSVYKNAGLNTDAHGIVFSMPVDRTIGLEL